MNAVMATSEIVGVQLGNKRRPYVSYHYADCPSVSRARNVVRLRDGSWAEGYIQCARCLARRDKVAR